MRYWNRNLISSTERLPTSSATSGIYDLVSQKIYKEEGLWPDSIAVSGLTMHLDAANSSSYPGTGTTWSDLSGNSNDATLENGPVFSSTNGGLFNFDGSNEYADCGNVLNLTAYTKSVWFRPEDGNGTNLMSGASGHALWMAQTTNKIAAGHLGNYTVVEYQLPSGDFLNDWSNAVVTYDNSSGFALYLNGSLVDSSTSTSAVANSDTKVYLGRYGSGYYFDGDIAQALLYNRAITASEVLANYNSLKTRFGL